MSARLSWRKRCFHLQRRGKKNDETRERETEGEKTRAKESERGREGGREERREGGREEGREEGRKGGEGGEVYVLHMCIFLALTHPVFAATSASGISQTPTSGSGVR